MEPIIAAALDAVGLILVAFIGYYGARKLGIGQNQERLVSTLKSLIDAQNLKIKDLESARQEDRLRIEQLEKRVTELSDLTIKQALENEKLRQEVLRPRRTRAPKNEPEGGE